MEALTKLADSGNAQAQNELGFMYETGQGVPESFDKALASYKAELENR